MGSPNGPHGPTDHGHAHRAPHPTLKASEIVPLEHRAAFENFRDLFTRHYGIEQRLAEAFAFDLTVMCVAIKGTYVVSRRHELGPGVIRSIKQESDHGIKRVQLRTLHYVGYKGVMMSGQALKAPMPQPRDFPEVPDVQRGLDLLARVDYDQPSIMRGQTMAYLTREGHHWTAPPHDFLVSNNAHDLVGLYHDTNLALSGAIAHDHPTDDASIDAAALHLERVMNEKDVPARADAQQKKRVGEWKDLWSKVVSHASRNRQEAESELSLADQGFAEVFDRSDTLSSPLYGPMRGES